METFSNCLTIYYNAKLTLSDRCLIIFILKKLNGCGVLKNIDGSEGLRL